MAFDKAWKARHGARRETREETQGHMDRDVRRCGIKRAKAQWVWLSTAGGEEESIEGKIHNVLSSRVSTTRSLMRHRLKADHTVTTLFRTVAYPGTGSSATPLVPDVLVHLSCR